MRSEVQRAIKLMRRQDPRAVNEALSLLQGLVFSFSMRVCGQRQDAEDTMQEVLLKSVPYLAKFDNAKALQVWLYKVAKNRCLMSRRVSRFARQKALSLDELMPDKFELAGLADRAAISPEASAMRRESAKHVRAAIQRLPAGYRLILVLHDMEELSDAEVGEITGLRPGTIRVRLHRARLFVRKELAQQENRLTLHRGTKPAGEAAARMRPRNCKRMFAELSDYLDEKLDPSLCRKLEEHFESCAPCREFLADLEQAVEQCRKAPSASPDRSIARAQRSELLARYKDLGSHLGKSQPA